MSEGSNWLNRVHRALPARRSAVSYFVCAVIFLAAAALKPALDHAAGEILPPFITFYPAVIIISLLGGPSAGVVALLSGVGIAWYYWIEPYRSFELRSPASAIAVATFVIFGLVIAGVAGATRRLLDEHVSLAEEQRRAARESVHRIKNLLAVVQAIASKIARKSESLEDFSAEFSARLGAMSRAQDVLLRAEWRATDLADLVQTTLEPFLPNPAMRISPGPDVMVPGKCVSGLCMALYELATNAVKYGALLHNPGRVELAWRVEDAKAILTWTETSGEATELSTSSGLGGVLIRNALASGPGARVEYKIAESGVTAHFEWSVA